MEEILIYSMVIASMSFTVSEAIIFKRLREKIKFRSKFFGKLICCGFCCGFYAAAIVMAIYQPRLFFSFAPVDYLFTWFVLSWLSGFQWAFMCLLWKITGK